MAGPNIPGGAPPQLLGQPSIAQLGTQPPLQVAPGPAPGGVDWLGGKLWIQRARGPGQPGPAPKAAGRADLKALDPAKPAAGPPFPDWCSNNAIVDADNLRINLPQPGPGGFQAWAGFIDPGGAPRVPKWAQALAVALPFGLDGLVITIARMPFRVLDWIIQFIPASGQCSVAALKILALWSMAAHWANKITGGGFSPAERAIEYMRQYTCPSEVISGDDAVQLELQCQLSSTDGHSWGAVNNWCKSTYNWRYWLAQIRVNPRELIALFFRGKSLAGLRDQCPGKGGAPGMGPGPAKLSDLLASMVNCGVADTATAQAILDTSYTLLDRGTILEALNRLRPGRDPSGVTYTQADAVKDLTAIGYQARDIKILIALSRHPPNFRQLQRPYEDDLLSLSDLNEFQRDDGLSEAGIAALNPFLQFLKINHQRLLCGAPPPAALTHLLAEGYIEPGEYASEISAQGYKANIVQCGIGEATAMRARELKAACIAGVKAGLNSGAMNVAQAAVSLAGVGVDQGIAAELVAAWACQRKNKSKPAGMGDLCTWVNSGLMSVAEYTGRLQEMGYSAADVNRVIQTCNLKQRARQEAARAKAARATAAEIKARIAASKAETAARAKSMTEAETAIKREIGTAKSVATSVKTRAKVDTATPKPAAPSPGMAASTVSGAVGPPVAPAPTQHMPTPTEIGIPPTAYVGPPPTTAPYTAPAPYVPTSPAPYIPPAAEPPAASDQTGATYDSSYPSG